MTDGGRPHPPARTDIATPRRSLVTGGAGFIGSHLVHALLRRGDHVTVVDNLSTGRRINLPHHHPRLEFLHTDLAAALSGPIRDRPFEEIYHLAAAVGVKLIVADPIGSIHTNIEQTAALLRFAASAPHPQVPHVLIASSSEVYGKSARLPFHEDDDIVYGPTTVSRWSYAMSKAIDEHLALAYFHQQGLPVTVTRFFNTVGPGQVGEYGMVLPRFVSRALAGQPIEVYGDGTQSRCFCDVRDVAGILPSIIRCPGRVYNVGSETPISMLDLATLVRASLDSTSQVNLIPYEQAYGPGFEDLAFRRPDVTRLREAVGFMPRFPLEATIRDVAAWLRADQRSGADWTDVSGTDTPVLN